jgi:SAM-dependent methyltransferase
VSVGRRLRVRGSGSRAFVTAPRSHRPYGEAFYASLADGEPSAQTIVPLLIDLLHPRSVVDVGCGIGVWLATFAQHGVDDFLGIDWSEVPSESLLIPRDRFRTHDLREPLRVERTFDLALSLEVAEHLPGEVADQFVGSLADLASAVLFSAAIPLQGGEQHLNEQWPDYWAARFQPFGYLPVDCIRPLVWANPAVHWWYSQNVLLFARPELIARVPRLAGTVIENPLDLRRVHPKNYLGKARQAAAPSLGVRNSLLVLGRALSRALDRRLRVRHNSS